MVEALFDNGAAWFTVPALVGTGIFVVRLILMLMGAAHVDIGVDLHHGDMSHGGGGHSGGHGHASIDQDSTYAFEILSLQSITSFMMGAGWGGFAALRGSGLPWPTSIAIAIACGGGMVWALALMLRGMHELQSSGNISIDAAIGAEGQVYVGIPPAGNGRGQVRLVIDQQDRVYNAVSADSELPTKTRVRVVHINDDNTVTVAAV